MAYTAGSPGAGLLEIGIALVLHDRFSNQAREASSQIRKLHLDAKNAINANLQAIQGLSQRGIDISSQASQVITGAVLEGAKFIDTMTTVKAITNATHKEYSLLQETAQSLGIKTMFDSKEIASGMQYLSMAGVQAKDISEMIEGAAMVANATGMQLHGKGGSADMLTNVMRMFRIESAAAASVVGDQLTKATLGSNMSMYDLAEAIKYAGADMVTLQQTLPSVAAMIGTLGNAGIQGSMAGTAISNMARYLNKSISQPTFKGAKALESIGLGREDFIDAKGNLLDFGVMLEKIWKAASNLTAPEINAVFQDIFGVRGNRAAIAIARDVEGYRNLLQKIRSESSGFAGDVVGERMSTIAGGIDIMRSSYENLKTTFTTAIAPVITPILKAFGYILDYMRQIFAIPFLGPAIATGIVFGTLILGIGSKLIHLRTQYLLFKNDSQVTSRSWFSILSGGWNSVILKAQQYMNIQRMIIAQQKSGIGASVGAMAMMNNPGTWIGNVRSTVSAKGRTSYWIRNESGGVVRTTAERAAEEASKVPKSTIVGATMGARGPVPLGTPVKFGTRLLSVGSKLLGFFGGPIGIAITGIAMGLPWLISKLSNNSKSSDSNTRAIDRLNDTNRESLMERLARAKEASEQEKLTDEMKNLARVIQYWGNQMSKGMPEAIVHSHINLDGKPIVDIVNKAISNNNTKQALELNTL